MYLRKKEVARIVHREIFWGVQSSWISWFWWLISSRVVSVVVVVCWVCWHPFSNLKMNKMIVMMMMMIINCVVGFVCVLHVALFVSCVWVLVFIWKSVCVCVLYSRQPKCRRLPIFDSLEKRAPTQSSSIYRPISSPLFVLCAGLFASHWRVSMETERVKKKEKIK